VGFAGDLAWALIDFCNGAGAAYDRLCGIYCATWYLVPTGLDKAVALRQFPFWMASWQASPPAPQFMAPWDHLTLWQYNADGIDKDRFEGTREQFAALGKASPGSPSAFQHAPGWLDPLRDEFDWTQDGTPGAGIITYRQVRAYNDETGVLYEREWEASTGFTPWTIVGDSGATMRPVGSPGQVE
jgi:hypothetical protein